MSTDTRDQRSEKPHRSKNFWMPIWITGIICVGGIAFSVGQYLTQQQWAEADNNALAADSMENPRYALAEAERELLDDRIDFPLYRDLLRGALNRADPEVRSAAYQSIHRVLASGRGCANALKKELASMPTQMDGAESYANRVDVQLAEVKASKPVKPGKKPVVVKAPHLPKAAQPGLVAQE